MGAGRAFQHPDPGLSGEARSRELPLSGLVLLDVEGPVATFTLNRPGRHNSLVPTLLEDLLRAIDVVRAEPGARAVVLRAKGRSFSTGGDLQGFLDHLGQIEAYASRIVGLLHQVILAIIDLPIPVVAAVQGPVNGGSLGLVLACDVVLLAPEAAFTPYYGEVGFSPDGGWTALLPAVIGAKRAGELLYDNRTLHADQALAWGLASRVVPAEELWEAADALAQRAAGKDPGSLRRTKRMLWSEREKLARRLETEREHFVAQIGEAETQRRMRDFLEKMNRR